MARSSKPDANHSESCPPLPIETSHWLAIVRAMKLSPRQATVAELLLRSMSLKGMARALGITVPTVRSHLLRIYARTGTRDKMALAMRVLLVSHEVNGNRDGHHI
jgi:DNA-binding CsgD family transcriptional regulator